MTTVVVAGALANKPCNGGEAWVRLTLVRGLLELGVEAHLVEESPDADERSIEFFGRALEQLGLSDRGTLIHENGQLTKGLSFDRLLDLTQDADLLLNVSGHLQHPDLMRRFRRRAYLDLDPGFTQFWHADGIPGARLDGHEIYFTVGANIGQPGCPIPTCGIQWRALRPPVLLDAWPVVGGGTADFTSVSSWRGPFGPIEADGRRYGLKAHEFRRFIALPQLTGQTFELALNIDPGDKQDLALLREHGWRLVEPATVADTPDSYRAYVQQSRAEFGVAHGVYVDTASGWFSDRSVRYLASGKPTLLQETGFSRSLPTGTGIVPFSTVEEAVDGAASIVGNYEEHSSAARGLAERYFDARLVLAQLLDECGVN